jgi:hypothetical protein
MESIATEEVIIDEHGMAEPARTPSPTAPTSPPVETEAEVEAASEAEAESGVIERGIIAVNRRSPDVDGIIGRHIYHLRVGRLNDDDLLPSLLLSCDRLLRRRRKIAITLCPGAHLLDRVHHVGLLREECVPKLGGPADILVQLRQRIRNCHQRLHAWIPGLLPRGVHERLAAEVLVPLQPLVCFHDLKRIGAGDQQLTQQRIGVESNRRHQVVELLRRPHLLRRLLHLGLLLRQRRRGRLLLRPHERSGSQKS